MVSPKLPAAPSLDYIESCLLWQFKDEIAITGTSLYFAVAEILLTRTQQGRLRAEGVRSTVGAPPQC